MPTFPFNIYLGVLVVSFLVSFLSLPLWRNYCLRTNHVDDPGHRKIHTEPIPLAGGLSVLTGFVAPILLVLVCTFLGLAKGLPDALSYGLGRRSSQLFAITAGAIGMSLLGWWDDRRELKPLPKFTGQFIVALLVAASGVRITLFVHNVLFSYAVTILWILTVINAFNFMDNMNGLCSGLGFIGAWCLALSSGLDGQYLVASFSLLIAGALLGFLPYNFPSAKAFLGDAGSHLVGFMMAVLAILPHYYSKENPHPWAVLKPLLILGVPLADMVMVVCIRTAAGKPFYVGDTNHLSHRLVRRGLSKTTAVVLIWLVSAIVGALCLF